MIHTVKGFGIVNKAEIDGETVSEFMLGGSKITADDDCSHEIKSATVSPVSPSICYEVMGPDAMILVSWMLSFKPAFSLSSFTVIFSSPFAFCHKDGVIYILESVDISPGNLDSSLWFI